MLAQLEQHPQVQEIIKHHPEIRQMLRDPETFRRILQVPLPLTPRALSNSKVLAGVLHVDLSGVFTFFFFFFWRDVSQ